jgi:pyruvate formate lyase activating enzyme
MTVEELVADVLKYKTFMNFSGGGFTASGGEPMLQVQFLAELFGQLKFYGIHTALDTSGHHNSQYAAHNARLLEKTDLILLDIKSINPEKYHALTSVDILPTLELLELARDKQIPVWVRYVVVPGLTDSLEEAQELARFLTTFDNVKRVEVQPFHKMGEYKWAELNIPYTLGDTPPPSEAVVADIERAFREKSLPV